METESNSGLVRRNVEKLLLETMADTPVAVLQGARQTGKSTLINMISGRTDIKYVTLDDPAALTAARADPVGFISQYPQGTLAVDEMQLFPGLLRIVKLSVDRDRRPGRFILTGSADLLHVSGANESLAGRAETIQLRPFSRGELEGVREDFVSGIIKAAPLDYLRQARPVSRDQYAQYTAIGGYPEAVMRTERRRNAFFRNYAISITDHDAAGISGLAHLDKLQTMLALLSAQTSGEFIQAAVAAKAQIPDSSLYAYIRLLCDLYLVHELPAWGRNLSSRVIARKKLSLADTGLASYFNGIDQTYLSDVMNGEIFGPLLESYVVAELHKQRAWSETDYSLCHFRNRDKKEVDIVIELRNGRIIGLEVKAAKSVSAKDFQGMRALRDLAGERFICGVVLYSGTDAQSYGSDMYFAPISAIWAA